MKLQGVGIVQMRRPRQRLVYYGKHVSTRVAGTARLGVWVWQSHHSPSARTFHTTLNACHLYEVAMPEEAINVGGQLN